MPFLKKLLGSAVYLKIKLRCSYFSKKAGSVFLSTFGKEYIGTKLKNPSALINKLSLYQIRDRKLLPRSPNTPSIEALCLSGFFHQNTLTKVREVEVLRIV